jgi:hypothetical protein
MEGLSLLQEEVAASPSFNFHPNCAAVSLNHLCFADDLLDFSAANVPVLVSVLH